ncbi:MAG: hypothetical protein ACRDOO_16660 [Actinomadura sp.]
MITVNRRLFIADLLCAGLLLAAACAAGASGSVARNRTGSPSPSASGSPHRLPTGFHRVSNVGKTISLGVPTEWAVIDLAGNPDADLARAGLDDPAIRAQVIEQLKAAGALIVIDTKSRPTSSTSFLTNLIAFCSPAPGGASVEALKSDTKMQLMQAGATNIQMTDTKLDGRPAVRTTFSGGLNGAETAALVDGQKCAVTLSTDQLPRYQRTFDQITATTDLT